MSDDKHVDSAADSDGSDNEEVRPIEQSKEFTDGVAEVKKWLSYQGMEDKLYVLLDHGYDHLPSVVQCTDDEAEALYSSFKTVGDRKRMRLLLTSLRRVGIDSFRSDDAAFRRELGRRHRRIDTHLTLRIGALNLKGFLALRRLPEEEHFTDKYCQLEGSVLSWLRSKKDGVVEGKIDMIGCTVAQDPEDRARLLIEPPTDAGFSFRTLEVYCRDAEEAQKWMEPMELISSVVVMRKCLPDSIKDVLREVDENAAASDVSDTDIGDGGDDDKDFAAVRTAARTVVEDAQRQEEKDASASTNSDANADADDKNADKDAEEKKAVDAVQDKMLETEDAELTEKERASVKRAVEASGGDEETKLPTLARTGSDIALIRKRKGTIEERKVERYLSMLQKGSIFRKYRMGKGQKRCVWVTPNLDFILWGTTDKSEVRGFLPVSTVTAINQVETQPRFYITSRSRTLELEADSHVAAAQWREAYQLLLNHQQETEMEIAQIKRRDGYEESHKQLYDKYYELLTRGDTFTKWPAKHFFGKSPSFRKIEYTRDLKSLQWTDTMTGKIKGSIPVEDILHVEEDPEPSRPLKFSLLCKGRALVMQAGNDKVKQEWIMAIRFFIDELH